MKYELDITKEHCPMTFVKTRLKLDAIQSGDILSVRLKKGEPLENVPKTVREFGHDVLDITPVQDDIYEVVIQKK